MPAFPIPTLHGKNIESRHNLLAWTDTYWQAQRQADETALKGLSITSCKGITLQTPGRLSSAVWLAPQTWLIQFRFKQPSLFPSPDLHPEDAHEAITHDILVDERLRVALHREFLMICVWRHTLILFLVQISSKLCPEQAGLYAA